MGQRADEITPQPTERREVYVDRDPMVARPEPTIAGGPDYEEVGEDERAETAEIRADIEQTRAEMSDTIDALQERLAPQTLVAEAKDAAAEAATNAVESAREAVREATIGRAEHVVSNVSDTARDTGSSVMDTIRDNPLPAALAGIGLGWLWMNRRRSPGRNRYVRRYAPDYDDWEYTRRDRYGSSAQSDSPVQKVRQTASDVAGQVRESAGDVADRTGEMVSGAGERLQESSASMWETVRKNPLPAAMATLGIVMLLRQREDASYDAYSGSAYALSRGDDDNWQTGRGDGIQAVAGEAGEKVRGAVDQAQEQVEAVTSKVYGQTRRTRSEINNWVNENPLGVAAVALGVGMAAGLAVPSTRPESELMGDTRDTFMERAREVVQDTGQKVQKVAEQATQAATEEARKQTRDQ